MENSPFYASGLKFLCTVCSACCRYDSGYVYLSAKDLEKLASALKMGKELLINKYCRWVGGLKGDYVLSLKEKPNKDCVFWDNGCTVYEGRPLQCIAFPFWQSIISSKESWDAVSATCPGMNSGKLHTKEAIDNFIKLRKSNPIMTREAL